MAKFSLKKMFNGFWGIGLPDRYPQGQTSVPNRMAMDPKDISTFIAPVQMLRIKQDLRTWRMGVTEAENAWYPYRVRMQRLFLDTVLNGHVKGCIQKRRNLTLLRDFDLVGAAGEPDEVWTEYFKSAWFDQYVSHVIDAQFFGYSLIVIKDLGPFGPDGQVAPTSVKIVKRQNISPDRLNVSSIIYMPNGYPFLPDTPRQPEENGFMEEPYVDNHIWVATPSDTGQSFGHPCGYGLLYEAGQYEIICRNVLGFEGDYVQVFGQPTKWLKTDKHNESPEVAVLEAALNNVASNGYMITSKSDELAFLETKGGGEDAYESLQVRCEKLISKIMLGHPDVIDSPRGHMGAGGSGQHGNSAAQDAVTEIQVVDGRLVERVTNAQLLPKLRNLGVPIPDGMRFRYNNDAELMEARQSEGQNNLIDAQWILALSQAGIGVADIDALSERLGIDLKEVSQGADAPNGDAVNKMVRAHALNISVMQNKLRGLDEDLKMLADGKGNI